MEFRITFNDSGPTRVEWPYKVEYRDYEDRIRYWKHLRLFTNTRVAQMYIDLLKEQKVGEVQ